MPRCFQFLSALALGLGLAGPVAAQDAEGSADHPLIGRYEGSLIYAYQVRDFEEVRLQSGPGFDDSMIREGAVTRIHYWMPASVTVAGAFRNFEKQLIAQGFEPVYNCTNNKTGTRECGNDASLIDNIFITGSRLRVSNSNYRVLSTQKSTGGATSYAQILASVDNVDKRTHLLLTIVEEEELEDKMIDATEMQQEIAENGRVALYGLYFDTGSDEIKSFSLATLNEMAIFLNTSSDLKVVIVGHTDNEGTSEYNLDLSKRRANAIVEALVSNHGIDRGRLQHAGVGFLSPVASNETDTGRALNRRVELIPQ